MKAAAGLDLKLTLASFADGRQWEAAENSMLNILDYFSPIRLEENQIYSLFRPVVCDA
jgi:hypothetical protein